MLLLNNRIRIFSKQTAKYVRLWKVLLWLVAICFALGQPLKGQDCLELQTDGVLGAEVPFEKCLHLGVGNGKKIFVHGAIALEIKTGCDNGINYFKSEGYKNVSFNINWGDGSPVVTIPVDIANIKVTGNVYKYSYNNQAPYTDSRFAHEYVAGRLECDYTAQIWLSYNGHNFLPADELKFSNFWQTDDYSGIQPLLLKETNAKTKVYPVCVGQPARIQFEDFSQLNCLPESLDKVNDRNAGTRHIQFGYGGTSSNIPGVKVAGVSVNIGDTRYDGGMGTAVNSKTQYVAPVLQNVARAKTSFIEIPGGITTNADIGKEFHVTLYNWNYCNPDHTDRNAAITTEAIIRIVPSPPAPKDSTHRFCYGTSNSGYSITLEHTGPYLKAGGTYTWCAGTDAGPTVSLFETTSKNFNPVTQPQLQSSQYAAYRLSPSRDGDRKVYWVKYNQETPESTEFNAYSCDSQWSKIIFEAREELSVPPTQNLRSCPGDTLRIYADPPNEQLLATPKSYPIGGQTEYIWTIPANAGLSILQTGPYGLWVDVKITREPAVLTTGTASINVSRRWATEPRCATTSRTLSVTVNPKPTASFTGDSEICPVESVDLVIKNIRGGTNSNSFQIKLSGVPGAVATTSNIASVNVRYDDLLPGTRNEFTITELKDNTTGCVNTSLTSSAIIKTRPKLEINQGGNKGFNVTTSHPCEGETYEYAMLDTLSFQLLYPDTQSMWGELRATKFKWMLDGIVQADGPFDESIFINLGSVPDPTQIASKTLAAYWHYTTPTIINGVPTDNYCPSDTLSKILRVWPKPTATILHPELFACLNETFNVGIRLTGVPSVTWGYSATAVTGGLVLGGSPTGIKDITYPGADLLGVGTHIYKINSVTQGGCSGKLLEPKTATVTILKNPTVTFPTAWGNHCWDMDLEIPITLTGANYNANTLYVVEYMFFGNSEWTATDTLPVGTNKLVFSKTHYNQGGNPFHQVILLSVSEITRDMEGNVLHECWGDVLPDGVYVYDFIEGPIANAGPDLFFCANDHPFGLLVHTLNGQNIGGGWAYSHRWSVVNWPDDISHFYWDNDPDHRQGTHANSIFIATKPGIFALEYMTQGDPVCPASRDTMMIHFGTTVTPANAGNNVNICGMEYVLQGNAPRPNLEYGEWSLAPGNGPSATATAVFANKRDPNTKVTVNEHGAYTFTWTMISGSCPQDNSHVTILFSQKPTLSYQIDPAAICSGDSVHIDFSADVLSEFQWNFAGKGWRTGNAIDTALVISGTISNTYNIEAKAANGACEDRKTFQITVKPKPQLALPNSTVCSGETIPFQLKDAFPSPHPKVTYDWAYTHAAIVPASGHQEISGPSTPIYQFLANNTGNAILRDTLKLWATINGCVSDTLEFPVQINPIPQLSVPADMEFCPETLVQEGTIQVSSTVAGTSMQWWHELGAYSGTPSLNGNATVVTANALVSLPEFTTVDNIGSAPLIETIKVSGSANGCAAASTKTFKITVNQRPNLNTVADQTVCPDINGNVTFANRVFNSVYPITGGIGYEWEVSDPYSYNALKSGTGNFTSANTNTNDHTSATTWAYDNLNPDGSDIQLTMKVTAKSNSKQCESQTSTKLTVKARPIIATMQPAVACPDDQKTIPLELLHEASGVDHPYAFRWNNNETGTGLSANGIEYGYPNGEIRFRAANTLAPSTFIQGNISVRAEYNYVKEGASTVCVGPEQTTTLTINPKPVIINPGNQTVCEGTQVPKTMLTTQPVGPQVQVSYEWFVEDNSNSSRMIFNPMFSGGYADSIPGYRAAYYAPIPKATINVTASATVNVNNVVCSSNTFFTTTVRHTPIILNVPSPDSSLVCPGDPVTVFSRNIIGLDVGSRDSIQWTFHDIDHIVAPASLPYPTTGSGNYIPDFYTIATNPVSSKRAAYTVNASIDGCAATPKTYTIVVKPTPDIDFESPAKYEYCNGETVALPRFVSSNIYQSQGTISYWWNHDAVDIGDRSVLRTTPRVSPFVAQDTSVYKLKEKKSVYQAVSILNGCPSDTMKFTLTLHPLPQMLAYDQIDACGGTPFTPDAFRLNSRLDPLPADADTNPNYFNWEIIDGWFLESGIPGPPAGPVQGYLPTFTPDTSNLLLWGDNSYTIKIRITPELYGCTGESRNAFILIHPLPNTEIASNAHDNCVAGGEIKTFSIGNLHGSASSYLWEIENPTPGTGDQPDFVNGINIGNVAHIQFPNNFAHRWEADLTVVEQSGHQCLGKKVSQHIVFAPKPVVNAGRDTILCSGDTLVLKAKLISEYSPNVHYSWEGSFGRIIGNTDTLQPVVHFTVSGLATVANMRIRAWEGTCLGDYDTVHIVVNPTPQAPVLLEKAYCASDKFMKMEVFNGATHQLHWQRIEGIAPPYTYKDIGNSTDSVSLSMKLTTIHSESLPNINFERDTSIVYQVYQINTTTGCVSPVSRAKMTINQAPANPIALDTIFCYNEDHTYRMKIPQGQYYINWYEDANKLRLLSNRNYCDVVQDNPSPFDGVNYQPFTYYVVAVGDRGCESEVVEAKLTVRPAPNAAFKHNVYGHICPPDSVLFENHSVNINPVRYTWSFGDGNFYDATADPFYYHYTNYTNQPSIMQVIMTATDLYGCEKDTVSYLTVSPQVIASFTADTSGCAPVTVRFTSQTYGASNYRWKYGDGATGADRISEHLYTNTTSQPKVYDVWMIAKNAAGCIDSVSQPMYVYPTPKARFEVDPDKRQGCQPLEVPFKNVSENDPLAIISYVYDFGDAVTDASGNALVTHPYINLQNYNDHRWPKLTATNEWGCTDTYSGIEIVIYPYLKADFRMSDTAGCAPQQIYFANESQGYNRSEWLFSDGGTSDAQSPWHTFDNTSMSQDKIYTITLTVYSGFCTDSQTKEATIYGTPKANFSVTPTTLQDYRSPITFTNLIPSIYKNDLGYVWSVTPYGSRNRGTVIDHVADPASYHINNWGKFDIQQLVMNLDGRCPDSLRKTVTIMAPVPIAVFDSVFPGCMPYTVPFKNKSQYGNSYQWDFGDGITSYAKEPIHTYQKPGTYVVTLTVTGDNEKPGIHVREIVVYPSPQADFTISPGQLMVGQTLRAFNATSHADEMGNTYKIWYRWDWGDGSSADTVESPSHMYRKDGKFDISLTVGTYEEPKCISHLTFSGMVNVEYPGDIILPNTFKPSVVGAPSNDVSPSGYQNNLFYPPVLSPTRKYSMTIFNRWGQMIFQTTDPNKGWNGYYNGRLCDEGVYLYKIEGIFETGQAFSKMGDVLLMR